MVPPSPAPDAGVEGAATEPAGGSRTRARTVEPQEILLSRTIVHTKALQQLAKEKEALHKALTESEAHLRASEARRSRAEERATALEHALRGVHGSAAAALGGLAEAEGTRSLEAEGS